MNRSTRSILLIFSLIILLVSCKKDDELPPTIEFKTTAGYMYEETMVAVGDSVKVGIIGKSNGLVNITSISARVNEEVVYGEGVNLEEFNMDFNIKKGLADEELWEFSIKDKNGSSASVSIKLTKDPDSEFSLAKNYPSVKLGGQENDSLGGFISFSEDIIYMISTASTKQSLIDLIYYYYGDDKNTIASAGANIEDGVFNSSKAPGSWETRRTTKFIKTSLELAEYEAIVVDSLLISSFNQTEAKRKAKELAVNDIYSFKTEDGRFGMFLVKDIIGEKEGMIEIAVKIQN